MARHLLVEVYARHPKGRDWGWDIQGKVKKNFMEEVMLNRILKEE